MNDDAITKAIVPTCCILYLGARIFLWTKAGQKTDQRVHASFSKVEADRRFPARFFMLTLRHPALLIPIGFVAIVAGFALYAYFTR